MDPTRTGDEAATGTTSADPAVERTGAGRHDGRARVEGVAAALFGALCIVLAFPTVDWVWPVVVAWAPLLAVVRPRGGRPGATARQRLLYGWLLGFVYQAVLFRWIVFTMGELSGLPPALGLTFLALFALWHGLMSGLFLALAEPVRRAVAHRAPMLAPLAVPVVYVAVEWMWPMVFPWRLGHAFWRVEPVWATSALTGPVGLSFVVLAISAVLAELVVGRRRTVVLPTLAVAIALLAFGVAWWGHLRATPPSRTLDVAVVQPNYSLEAKKNMTAAVRARLLERVEGMLRELPAERYDLVVASEGAFPWFWRLDGEGRLTPGEEGDPNLRATERILRAIDEGPSTDVVLGGLRRPPGGPTRNAAVHVAGDGTVQGVYDKNVLVPFGEYVPGRSIVPALRGSLPGITNMEAGEGPCNFRVDGVRLACGICYEAILPVYTHRQAREADLLLNLTIDVWFGRSTAPWFHLMSQTGRAVEHGIPLVRSALTGISAVVGADGGPDRTLGLNRQGVLDVRVPLRDVRTPYAVVGPLFPRLCSGAVLLLLAVGLVRARRRRDRSARPEASPRSASGEASTGT